MVAVYKVKQKLCIQLFLRDCLKDENCLLGWEFQVLVSINVAVFSRAPPYLQVAAGG